MTHLGGRMAARSDEGQLAGRYGQAQGRGMLGRKHGGYRVR
jgi:hypothetical protein